VNLVVQPGLGRSTAKRPPWRGLLDLVAVGLASYALWFTTPVGALLSRTVAFVTGTPARTRPLIAYFRTQTEQAEIKRAVLDVVRRPPPEAPVTRVADKFGVSPSLARALVMVSSDGKTDPTGHFQVSLGQVGQRSLIVVGLNWPTNGTAAEKEAILIDGVARLQKRLGGVEAAVAALAVDLAQVRYALDRARAAGTEHPERFTSFGPYLPAKPRAEASPLVHGTFALATAYAMGWPVASEARVSSPFGPRVHPVLGVTQKHLGLDLAVPTGTPVAAIAAGEVIIAGVDAVNGRFVKIDHGHGLVSAYCHGSSLQVSRGGDVKQGQVVLSSGASGRVSGPHLHFQLELDGVPIDPELFRPGG
jgi:murein DD-endopeptidase MepM/ murein hydrolase activator NlpD